MFAKIPRICNLEAMSNGQGPAAEGVTHKNHHQQTPKTVKQHGYLCCGEEQLRTHTDSESSTSNMDSTYSISFEDGLMTDVMLHDNDKT